MLEYQLADLAAVKLSGPGDAGIAAAQHHAIVADRPALGGRRKTHRREIRADRYCGLLPVLSGVIGIKNVPALPHGDQTLPRLGNTQQGAARRQGTRLGRQIQHVNVGRCQRAALQQRQQHSQHQWRDLLVTGAHVAPSWQKGAGWYLGTTRRKNCAISNRQ
ncbi:hypothetical protein D3C75_877360 [compost metagenome]